MDTRKNAKNNLRANNEHINFEETAEGREILNAIGATWHQIRKENSFHGEAGILMTFAKKNRTKYYTAPFEKDIDKLVSPKTSKETTNKNVLLPLIQKHQNYKTPPSAKN